MNLLVTTLGTSWQIVPELYGFTNPEALDLYALRSDVGEIAAARANYGIEPVDEVWVITTVDMSTDALYEWAASVNLRLRLWRPAGASELATAAENEAMADLIYRSVLLSHETKKQGRLYLSLAGGRKTMSAEMQQAGMVFGCDALLHVVDRQVSSNPLRDAGPEDFSQPLRRELADILQPLVILGHCPRNGALEVDPPVRSADYPLSPEGGTVPPGQLYQTVKARLKQAGSLILNFSREIGSDEHQTNFHALYTLPPETVRRLHEQRIGADPARRDADLTWLSTLPKSDLHCHLGGVLDTSEMIEVATAMEQEIAEARQSDPRFARLLAELTDLVATGDPEPVRRWLPKHDSGRSDLRAVRAWHTREPIGVCGFLLCFQGRADLLDAVIFGDLQAPTRYCGVGIEGYEPLGDLQGSGLLQSPQTLRATCEVLKRKAQQQNIRYLELRCSPHNYTRGGMSAVAVTETLMEVLEETTECDIRLLFIASRHRRMSEALQHVELAEELRGKSSRFRHLFVGFDLAGNEAERRPSEMRAAFRPLLEACIPITIHAGEDQAVENIWEAVYELSADRIGHGLTLGKHPDLLQRFVERRIAVEMCPSSNFQIVGYTDRMLGVDARQYPLAEYLKRGLRVTVNTDNPGISRTDASRELYKAAAMSENGLTRWQILQLVRNGFQAGFCPLSERRRLLRAAESELLGILSQTTD